MRSSLEEHGRQRRRRATRRAVIGIVLLVALVLGANAYLVGRPTAAALAADTANAGIDLRARFQYRLDPTTLVLDLRATRAAPEDAFRALVEVAAALATADRRFERVVLAHGGDPVFLLAGADFARLGADVGRRLPTVVARGVPALLRGPEGAASFGPWAGALPPVLGLQFPDAASAARRWVSGGR